MNVPIIISQAQPTNDVIPGVTNYFFTQGILGIIVIVLTIVIVKIYNSREKERIDHQIETKALQKEKESLMEARRVDAVETRTEVTSILPGIAQSLLHISDKIEAVQQIGKRRKG